MEIYQIAINRFDMILSMNVPILIYPKTNIINENKMKILNSVSWKHFFK